MLLSNEDIYIYIICIAIFLGMIYLAKRFGMFGFSKKEGMQNMDSFKSSMLTLEKSTFNPSSIDLDKIKNLVEALKNPLYINQNRSKYEEILIQVEELCDIIMLTLSVRLAEELTNKNRSDTYSSVNAIAEIVNNIAKYKENLNNHVWQYSNTTPGTSNDEPMPRNNKPEPEKKKTVGKAFV